MTSPRFLLIALILALHSPSSSAFVTYLVGGQSLMRWNVDSNAAHTNVVNRNTKKVRYFIASDTFSTANRAQETNAIIASFDQWEKVPGSKLKFELAGFVGPQADAYFDNQNVIFWAKNNLLVVGGTVNLSNRRGYTQVTFSYNDGSILDADIILNGKQFDWFTDFNNKTNQALFIESVLLHEIGHFVGLDHTPIGGATVVHGPPGVGTEAGLSADEIAAMRHLYPDGTLSWATIKGKVTRQGTGILGAAVILEDAHGNIAAGTVSRGNGEYELPGLSAGLYQLRVCPLDPADAPSDRSLYRPWEIAPEYDGAVTSFLPTTNIQVTVRSAQIKTLDVAVENKVPPFRITSISKPSTINLVSANRNAVTIQPGFWTVAVSSTNLQAGSTLRVTGDGLIHGETVFKANAIGAAHALSVPLIVQTNATPGLRSFVVTKGTNVAYANGYLEITPAVPDYNFDGLDDTFQRQYFARWTGTNASPTTDADNDMFSNRLEYEAGTNPTNSASYYFAVESVRREATRSLVTFKADVGRKYQLYSKPAINSSRWVAVAGAVTATNILMTVSDTAVEASAKFYRVVVVP